MTGALAGALTGLLAFIPLYDKPNFPLRSLIATLAISLMGGQCLLWLFTPRVRALPKIFGVGSIHIGPATASYDKIGAIASSAILLLLTLGWMKGSRRGLEIRAMMQNPEGAALVGVGLRSAAMAAQVHASRSARTLRAAPPRALQKDGYRYPKGARTASREKGTAAPNRHDARLTQHRAGLPEPLS